MYKKIDLYEGNLNQMKSFIIYDLKYKRISSL